MKEEIEKIFNKYKEITKEPWILMIVLLIFFGNNKVNNLEELDNLLARLEKGDTDLLKEVTDNEQSIRHTENDKKS